MANGKPPEDDAGRSLEQLADEHSSEDDGQLFIMEGGVKIGLSALMQRGTPVHYEFKLAGKSIKGAAGMGLISFSDPERTLVVPGRAGKIEVDPTYDAEGNCKHLTVRQHFKPMMTYDSRTEAAQVALRGE